MHSHQRSQRNEYDMNQQQLHAQGKRLLTSSMRSATTSTFSPATLASSSNTGKNAHKSPTTELPSYHMRSVLAHPKARM